eukprot:UN31513
MCQITGDYFLDVTMRASENEQSDTNVPLMLQLGLDPACPTTIGTMPLAGALTSYRDAALTDITQEFDIYEKGYFLLTMESFRDIADTVIHQIELKQSAMSSIIYLKGDEVNFASNDQFGFEMNDGPLPNQENFEFIFNPQYIDALLTGSEITICVD